MVRVLVADDHVVMRKGLRQILLDRFPKAMVDEAGNGNEVIEQVWNNNYDAILMDISMPGKDGIDVMKEIKSNKPDLPVLIISMYPEDQYAIRAIKAGASGYVMKSCSQDELSTALERVLNGDKYVSTSLAIKLASYVENENNRNNSILPHEFLSDREYEIMCLMASGKSLKEIACELSLSPKTISTYRSRLMDKMNMKNNVELINYVIRKKLIKCCDCYDKPE